MIEWTGPADADQPMTVVICMLATAAPSALLAPGNRFELYEGHLRVARGQVLGEPE